MSTKESNYDNQIATLQKIQTTLVEAVHSYEPTNEGLARMFGEVVASIVGLSLTVQDYLEEQHKEGSDEQDAS